MSFVYNPKNFIYFKTSEKRRLNKVGTEHSSAALLENATGDDKVMSFKFGSRLARLSQSEPLLKNYVGKASIELIKGGQTNLLKSKLFARFTHKIGDYPFYGQLCLNAGHIARLGENKESQSIRVNDAFYLSNFKGIRNIGYHYDTNAKKKGLGGDILGFDRFATLNLKVA